MTAPGSILPRRILMTADTVGGVWPYALQLGAGLADRGITTVLATMGRPPDCSQRAAAAAVPGLLLEVGPFALEWMPGAEADLEAAGEWLRALERRYRPDLVHLNGYAHATLPWRAPSVVVAHSCVQTWWRAVWGEPAPAEWDDYTRRVAAGLAAAGAVVAPSAAFLGMLEEVYGHLPQARVIHNGCSSREAPCRRKESFILAAGRLWDEAKNVATLGAAVAALPWPAYVAGDAVRPDGRTVDLDGVQALGPLDPEALADRMARAAIFVSPARYEPFGLAVLEAAQQGCALLLADIPTFRELWRDAALFVPPGDPDRIRDLLRGLIGDPARRARLGAAARRRAADYSAARMTEGYLALYAELAATSGAAPRSARRRRAA